MEDMRLLLASLKLVQIVVLSRPQPERDRVVVRFERFGSVLPEVLWRNGNPAFRRCAGHQRRRPAAATRAGGRLQFGSPESIRVATDPVHVVPSPPLPSPP